MEERTVELRKIGVRGAMPLCLKWIVTINSHEELELHL